MDKFLEMIPCISIQVTDGDVTHLEVPGRGRKILSACFSIRHYPPRFTTLLIIDAEVHGKIGEQMIILYVKTVLLNKFKYALAIVFHVEFQVQKIKCGFIMKHLCQVVIAGEESLESFHPTFYTSFQAKKIA